MTIHNEIQALDDLLAAQEVRELLDQAERIADQLEAVGRGLDGRAFRLASVIDRGAMSRIARAAFDAALAMRPTR